MAEQLEALPDLPLLERLRHWLLFLLAFARAELTDSGAVKLLGRRLERLPPRLPGRARSLHLARNRLTVPAVGPQLATWTQLVVLDLGNNALSELPLAVCSLTNLVSLNVAGNGLKRVPPQVRQLSQLRTLGLRSNQLTELPAELGWLPLLESLFVTDNQLAALPAALGRCSKLRKLQAASNRLASLPVELFTGCPELEMLRVPCNRLASLPPAAATHPRLCWLSLANNPLAPPPPPRRPLPEAVAAELTVTRTALGAGASGGVNAASWRGQPAALKRFVAGVSPDGNPQDEIAALAALPPGIPSCVSLLALQQTPLAAVMARAPGTPLAGRPSAATKLLRCGWNADMELTAREAVAVTADVAAALAACHAAGVAHGDLYGHNVLLQRGRAPCGTLCDFGAAFATRGGVDVERLEVRAFGILVGEIAEHTEKSDAAASLAACAAACLAEVGRRPRFAELAADLGRLRV